MSIYGYLGERYDSTKAKDMKNLAYAIARENCIVDTLDFDSWLNKQKTASEVLHRVEEYGLVSTQHELLCDCEEQYVEANWRSILRDYGCVYEVVDEDEEECE